MSSSRTTEPVGARVSSVVRTGRAMGALGLGLPLAWIGYSALAIAHRLPLPQAIDAEQRSFESLAAGRVSYYLDRRGQGRPLVLMHSINAAASSYEMKPLFEYYRGRRPVFAIDLPGFGFSARVNRPYTPELYVTAVLEFLRHELPGEGVDLVALSLSSEFAAQVALREPDHVRSLTMISPTGFSSTRREIQRNLNLLPSAVQRRERLLSNPLWSQAFYDLLVSRPSLHWFLSRSFYGPVDPGLERYAYTTSHQPGARFAPIAFVSGQLFTPDVRDRLYGQLQVPTLVLFDRDAYTDFGGLEGFIAHHTTWRAERIAPTRGLPQFEQLEATVRALDDFWTELSGARGGQAEAGRERWRGGVIGAEEFTD